MRPAVGDVTRRVRSPQTIPHSSLGTDIGTLGIPEEFRERADLSEITLESKAQ